MIRALWTAASGMLAQQLKVDTIANNLANVNTVGFKKNRVDFQDLLYTQLRLSGAVSQQEVQLPTGLEVGHGVRPAATQRLFGQGSLQQTENPLDLAIQGDGFFQIRLPDDTVAYTRDGTFKLDGEGRLVTSDGYLLEWDGDEIPPEALMINVAPDGTVTALMPGEDEPEELGQIELARFLNPAGLESLGANLYRATPASGEAEVGIPGEEGMGTLLQGYLETSNVQVVEEMVELIAAQRAYELTSRAIQSADDMLALANNLRR
ncbi:MAG: flagellar basal-body rod protein FlgG [Acetobacteraceae bacterium]|nr:flagellar basal-body rod protein FlgG [Acetobacteraceae bacterium]